jgi:DNA glycosylase AlkZ-like
VKTAIGTLAKDNTCPREPTPVTWAQVHAFRMIRHHLDRPVSKSLLVQAVADACGVQAQIMTAAQLALRVRVCGLTIEDIKRALWQDRNLVRVWCMRGAVHIVPAQEFAVFVRGSSTRQQGRSISWLENNGASPDSVDHLLDAFAAAIDRPRTRAEIADHIRSSLDWPIEKAGGRGWGSPSDAPGFRLGRCVVTVPDIAWMAAYRGLAVFGPDQGQGTTFVRPDVWLPRFRDLSLEDAEDALLHRYLRAFGPATVSDFAAWSILTLRRARQIWDRVKHTIYPVAVNGQTTWVLQDDIEVLKHSKLSRHALRLLPYFDSFLMGHKSRDHLVEAAHYKQIYRPAGWVYPSVLLDGRIVGQWSYKRTKRQLQIAVQLYAPINEHVKELVLREAEDIARFLDLPEARVQFAQAR